MSHASNGDPKVPQPSKPNGRPAAADLVPASIRRLLGPVWLVDGEDPQLYEELLAQVRKALQPEDFIDWLSVKNFVDLTWRTWRSQRQREGIVRLARRKALAKVLKTALLSNEKSVLGESPSQKLASGWFTGDVGATKEVKQILAKAKLTESDVIAQAMSDKSVELDRIEQQVEQFERRCDQLERQIEGRRNGTSKLVKQASEQVIEAEYSELNSNGNAVALSSAAAESSKKNVR